MTTFPKIDAGWQISAGQNRITCRWYAHLSYLEPEAFDVPKTAQHVSTVRGFRTPNEAITEAMAVAAEDDRRFEAQADSEWATAR